MSYKKLKWALIVFGIIGVLDAGYLTFEHYTGYSLGCTLLEGCNAVTSSVYSEIFGIPVALIGLLGYISILVLSVYYLNKPSRRVLLYLLILASFGFLASLYFAYLQIAVIEALCLYCMISAMNMTLIFVVSLLLYRQTA